MGDLSPEEIKEVESMATTHKEVKNELDRIELALEQYAVMYGTLPPAGTLTNIHSEISNAGPPLRSSGPTRNVWISTIAIAMVCASLAAWSLYKGGQTREDLSQTQEEFLQLQFDCEAQGEQVERQAALIDLLLNPNTLNIKMEGTPLAHKPLLKFLSIQILRKST